MQALSVQAASPDEAFVLCDGLTAAGYGTELNGDRIEVTFGARDHDRRIVNLLNAIEDCLTRHTIGAVKLALRGNRYIVRARPHSADAAN